MKLTEGKKTKNELISGQQHLEPGTIVDSNKQYVSELCYVVTAPGCIRGRMKPGDKVQVYANSDVFDSKNCPELLKGLAKNIDEIEAMFREKYQKKIDEYESLKRFYRSDLLMYEKIEQCIADIKKFIARRDIPKEDPTYEDLHLSDEFLIDDLGISVLLTTRLVEVK